MGKEEIMISEKFFLTNASGIKLECGIDRPMLDKIGGGVNNR